MAARASVPPSDPRKQQIYCDIKVSVVSLGRPRVRVRAISIVKPDDTVIRYPQPDETEERVLPPEARAWLMRRFTRRR